MSYRFLMLSFDYIRPKDPNISLAAASIMANLKSKLPYFKPNIHVFHRRFDVSNGNIEKVTSEVLTNIKEIRPQSIGTGVYVWNEVFVSYAFQQMAKQLRLEQKPFIILGGPQITYSLKGSLERLYPFAHAFVRGYAEESLLNLLMALTASQKPAIKGVYYSGSDDMGLKSDLNLSCVPSPLLSGNTQHSGYIRMETKRGCHFGCCFCQHRDSYHRRQSFDSQRIEKEIEWIVKENINDISIVDPIFNTPKSHYLEVMDSFLRYDYKGRLNLQTRLEMINDNYIDRCVRLMANKVKIELECGVQTVNREEMIVMDRPQSLARLEKMAQKLKFNEIPFEVSLIYGLPLQTVDSFKRTVDFVNQKIKPNRIRAWPLMLLRGTKMYDMKGKYNLREKVLDGHLKPLDDLRQYNGIPHVISSSTFNENHWIQMKNFAQEFNSKDEL